MEILLTGGCDSPSAKGVVVGVDTVVTTEISSPSVVEILSYDGKSTYGKLSKRRWDTAAI